MVKMTVDDQVASTDLQNPADALEFLAHVAERTSGRDSIRQSLLPMQSSAFTRSPHPMSSINALMNEKPPSASFSTPLNVVDYPPLTKGQLSLQMLHELLYR